MIKVKNKLGEAEPHLSFPLMFYNDGVVGEAGAKYTKIMFIAI